MPFSGAICFDLFNTLVNVGQVPESVGRFTADILGIDRQVWNQACFGPAHDITRPTDALQTLTKLAHSINPNIPDSRIRKAAIDRQARFNHALIHVKPEILSSLQKLKVMGFKLGLVSNASSGEVQAWSESPLASIFDTTHFSCFCGYAKPHTGIYHLACGELEELPANCLFVGDGGSDEHFGAHQAGMKPLLISHYLNKSEYKKRLEYYSDVIVAEISNMEQLEDYCQKIKKGASAPSIN